VTAVYREPIGTHKESLAQTLRQLRAGRRLSLAELARATGISSSFLSLVEQGRSDITIGRLIRLAEFYDVELADLLSGEHGRPADPVLVLRADPNHVIHSDEEGVDVFDLTAGSRWTLVPMLGVHQPGGGVQVEDVHERESLVFVLEGTFELEFTGGTPVRLRRGEGAIYRSVAPYRFTNVGQRRGRVLAVGLHPSPAPLT
jgi:transcriptional regulator with XRE-family HTH domain